MVLLVSCKTETEKTTNSIRKQFENGKYIEVVKTDESSTHYGMITHTNYGTTHRFNYRFSVNKNEVVWNPKNSAEPKKITFTKDSVFLQSIEKRNFPYQEISADTTITKHKDSLVFKYEVYIDNRYFFKLLGDDFWLDIPSSQYKNTIQDYKIFEVPNDNEYQIERKN